MTRDGETARVWEYVGLKRRAEGNFTRPETTEQGAAQLRAAHALWTAMRRDERAAATRILLRRRETEHDG